MKTTLQNYGSVIKRKKELWKCDKKKKEFGSISKRVGEEMKKK